MSVEYILSEIPGFIHIFPNSLINKRMSNSNPSLFYAKFNSPFVTQSSLQRDILKKECFITPKNFKDHVPPN